MKVIEQLSQEQDTKHEYDTSKNLVYVEALDISNGAEIPKHRIDLFFDDSSQEVMTMLVKTEGVTEVQIKGSHVINMLTGGTFFAHNGESLDPRGFSDIDLEIIGNADKLGFPKSATVESKTVATKVVTHSGVEMDVVKPAKFEKYETLAAYELGEWLRTQPKDSQIQKLRDRLTTVVQDNENRERNNLPIERAYYMHETLTLSARLENGAVTYKLNDPYNLMENAIDLRKMQSLDTPAATIEGPSHILAFPVRRVEGVKAVLLDAMEYMNQEEIESPAYLHALEAVARSTKFSMENSLTFGFVTRQHTESEDKHVATLKQALRGKSVNIKGDFLTSRGFEDLADVVKLRLQESVSRSMAVDSLGFYQTFVQEYELTEAISPMLTDLYEGVDKDMLPTFADFVHNAVGKDGKVSYTLDKFMLGMLKAMEDRYSNNTNAFGRVTPLAPDEKTIEIGMFKMAYAYMCAQENGVFVQNYIASPDDGQYQVIKLAQGEPVTTVEDSLAMLLYSHNRFDDQTLQSVVDNWQLSEISHTHWSEHGTSIDNALNLPSLQARINYYKSKYPLPFAETHPNYENS